MNWIPYAVSILIAEGAGGVGGFFTASKIPTWYPTLAMPSWQPPSWVFGPVWTTLYFLMGVAAAMIWNQRKQSPHAKSALIVYGVQLVLNLLWSIFFFSLESPALALICIVALWFAIALTLYQFWRINRTAGALLIPYILWVSFAAALNYTIWNLN